ncbi:MAG: flagellar protein FlgN [Gammaproteobacteria bacterium]|nr:flagellar protein FlgN [Gammaproteobacteria bacterium]
MSKLQLKQLWQLLQREQQGYQQLYPLLQYQARLLTNQDHQGLLIHNPRQLQLTEQLAQLARQREQLQTALGSTTLDALAKRLPDSLARPLLELWQTLLTLARRCRVLNDSNGRMLASQKEWLEQRMGVTQGVYHPD